MKLLVTGGCGFLGSNLVADALHRSDQVCVFDNMSRRGATENLSWLRGQGTFEFVQGDVRNEDSISKVVGDMRPNAIFHLAGQVAMTTSLENPRLDFEVNALGTLNVLEAVRNVSPDTAVIYSSTNKVYGDLEWITYDESDTRFVAKGYPNGFSESLPLDFRSPYGCSKGTADQYMLDYNRMYGLKTVVFRHSSMYGGRQFATFDQGWIGWFCQQALATKRGMLDSPFTISGTGKQVRDVLHATDMKKLYASALAHMDAAAGRAFNIGGGANNSLSLLELLDFLGERLDVDLVFDRLPARASDQRFFVADVSRAEELLGWRPRVGFEQGIQEMLLWLSSNE